MECHIGCTFVCLIFMMIIPHTSKIEINYASFLQEDITSFFSIFWKPRISYLSFCFLFFIFILLFFIAFSGMVCIINSYYTFIYLLHYFNVKGSFGNLQYTIDIDF